MIIVAAFKSAAFIAGQLGITSAVATSVESTVLQIFLLVAGTNFHPRGKPLPEADRDH